MTSTLARKISTVGVSRSPIPDIEYLGNRFVQFLEEEFRQTLMTSVAGMVLESEVTRLQNVTEGIPVPAMLGVVQFPGASNQAMVVVSADLVFHIIDLLMGGDAGKCPMPTTRSFTKIDEALCETVLTRTLQAFERAIEASLEGEIEASFSLVDTKQNITDVNLASGNADVLFINSSLDIGSAARGGDIDILVPLSVLDLVCASIKRENDTTLAVNDVWRARMKRAVSEAPVPLTAVLHRTKLTPDVLRNLAVGDVLEIPKSAPQNVSLVLDVGTKREQDLGKARLGAFEGDKVVKLAADPDLTLQQYLKKAMGGG